MQSGVTVLGCGVAGSWIAHHLASLGVNKFILFGGAAPTEEMARIGPYGFPLSSFSTAASALAYHIQQFSSDCAIDVREDFDIARDLDLVKGLVIGTMRGHKSLCVWAYEAVTTRGHQWVTLGLPCSPEAAPVVGCTPDVLDDDHFQPPACSKLDAMTSAAQAARLAYERL